MYFKMIAAKLSGNAQKKIFSIHIVGKIQKTRTLQAVRKK